MENAATESGLVGFHRRACWTFIFPVLHYPSCPLRKRQPNGEACDKLHPIVNRDRTVIENSK